MHTEIDLDELLSDMQGPSTEDLSQPKPTAPAAVGPAPAIEELVIEEPTPVEVPGQDIEALLAEETTAPAEIPPAVAEPAPRNGLDITFSAPMDFSLAFAVGDEADRARLLQAQKDAQDRVMDAIAAHAEEEAPSIADLSTDWSTAELTPDESHTPVVPDATAPAVVKPELPKVAIPKIVIPHIPRKAVVIGGGALLALAFAGGVAHWVLNRPAAVVSPTTSVKADPAVKTASVETTPAVKTEPASPTPATSSPTAPVATPPPAKPAPTEAAAPAPAAAAPTPAPKVEPAPKPAAQDKPAPTQAAPPKAVPPTPAEAKPQAAPAPAAKPKPAATPKPAAKPKAKKGWQDKADHDMDAYLNGLKKN